MGLLRNQTRFLKARSLLHNCFCLLLQLSFFSGQLAHGQCLAAISGTVLSDAGTPIQGATVRIFPQDRIATDANGILKTSDATGAFQAAIPLKASTEIAYVLGSQRDLGYPDDRVIFYLQRKPLIVNLNCHAATTGVALVLGPKSGYIRKLMVTGTSGALLNNATITLQRLTVPYAGVTLSATSMRGTFPLNEEDSHIPIPSGQKVQLTVSQKGFDDQSRIFGPLAPGENIDLVFQMKAK